MKILDTTPFQSGISIPKAPFSFLLFATRPYMLVGTASIAVVVLGSAFSQGTSYFFKLIVDASEVGDSRMVLIYALLFPVSVFLVQMLYRISGVLGSMWTTSVKKEANTILVRYLMQHSYGYFTNRFAGSLLTKIRNVVSGIDSFISDLLWTHVSAVTAFSVTAFFIVRADMLSGLLFLSLIVVLIAINRLFAPKKQQISYEASEQSTKLSGRIVDVLTNISATRQYVRTKSELDAIQDLAEKWRKAGLRNWHFTEIMLFVNTLIIFLFSFFIFYFLVIRWQGGGLTTGDFVFILALYAQITGTLLFIGRAFNSTARVIGEVKEGLSEILIPYEIIDRPDARALTVTTGEIVWDAVGFTYGENDVFKDFSLTIQGGERIGLVGESGAGKSTFVSLLLRQHELTQGRITIDNQDIKDVTQDSLREHIAVVPQEPMLFHRTIRENIAYGKPDATMDEIIAVAKKAEVHTFVMSLKDGYDTMVGERGVKLSGGQKQRIAIARAILKDAPILILDEATSALDSESEVAIQKALHELMVGKTVIAIAHRLSTLREMDRIIVLEKGTIVESGTHTALSTKSDGVYARLWKHQAGGFLVE